MIGISREQWTLVAAALALGGDVRVGLEDNFYLPDGDDGALERRPRRAGARDGRGRRAGAWRRSPRRARCSGVPRRERPPACEPAARGRPRAGPLRLLPGGFCSLLLADFGADVIKVEDTGMGDYVRWAPPYYEGAEPSARGALFLALNRDKRSIRLDLKARRRARRAAAARARAPTSCSSRSGPACWTASASATSACARTTRGSCTARSPATARTGRTRDRAGHDIELPRRSTGCSG